MKPILFNTEMVRAILEDRKTVTRRVMKPQPYNVIQPGNVDCWCGHFVSEDGKIQVDKPPYRLGDILYVRETFFEHRGNFYYKADGKHDALGELGIVFKWRPSIHMPREAARIFLRVTGTRVERLQDITEEQAVKEGFEAYNSKSGYYEPATLGFVETWNSTIKKADRAIYGWEANPWVWVIEFERCEKPEGERRG